MSYKIIKYQTKIKTTITVVIIIIIIIIRRRVRGIQIIIINNQKVWIYLKKSMAVTNKLIGQILLKTVLGASWMYQGSLWKGQHWGSHPTTKVPWLKEERKDNLRSTEEWGGGEGE